MNDWPEASIGSRINLSSSFDNVVASIFSFSGRHIHSGFSGSTKQHHHKRNYLKKIVMLQARGLYENSSIR